MESQIAKAINEHRLLRFYYEPGLRIVEPHALGISADGNLLLRAYQTGGASKSGEHANWKLFRLEKIVSLEVGDETFVGARPGYNPNDPAMKTRIIAHL
jgi:predicted DNA-binding transcriptional regulator YafY